MNTQNFFNTWTGKYIDFDSHYGAQCMDLYRQYCFELGVPQSPGVTGAADVWNTYLPQYFDRIPNTPLGLPQLGDIMIWSYKLNNYGHIAIVNTANLFSFTSFDQNFPVGSPCHLQAHSYKYVLGWLRPKTSLPKVPLKIARIGFQMTAVGDLQANVALYSSGKISLTTNDYIVAISGRMDQERAYKLVDLYKPTEKFVLIFYQGTPDQVFMTTYSYPARDCVITTCPLPGNGRGLSFELAHQLQYFYNDHRGSNPPVEVIDSNFPSDDLIRSKYNSVSKFYE